MEGSKNIRPLPLLPTVIAYLIPVVILYLTHYVLVPSFLSHTGYPYLVGYLIGWPTTMALFFIAALVAYRLEGNPSTWTAFAARYRLGRLSGQDWLWTLGTLIVSVLIYAGLGFTARWLASIPLFAPHPSFAPEFGPEGAGAHIPGELFEMVLANQWWVALVFFLGWFFNIFGEELWFRGYILSRQELAFGKRAWIVHGIMFGLNHIWQPWNLLLILPGAVIGAYVVQRRRNTWILIISHGLMNLSLLIIVLLNVLGIPI